MPVIDIDFDVYKSLTVKRETESDTYNDVLRRILKLEPLEKQNTTSTPKAGMGWVSKGVTFPDGTEFRTSYKGQVYTAKIARGRLVTGNGAKATSLSQAARIITQNSVDGWAFWEVKRPGDIEWRKAKELRESLVTR